LNRVAVSVAGRPALSIPTLLSEALRHYRRHWRLLAPLAVVVLLLAITLIQLHGDRSGRPRNENGPP
jgi:hypothetical protein